MGLIEPVDQLTVLPPAYLAQLLNSVSGGQLAPAVADPERVVDPGLKS